MKLLVCALMKIAWPKVASVIVMLLIALWLFPAANASAPSDLNHIEGESPATNLCTYLKSNYSAREEFRREVWNKASVPVMPVKDGAGAFTVESIPAPTQSEQQSGKISTEFFPLSAQQQVQAIGGLHYVYVTPQGRAAEGMALPIAPINHALVNAPIRLPYRAQEALYLPAKGYNGLAPGTFHDLLWATETAPQVVLQQALEPNGWLPSVRHLVQSQELQSANNQGLCAERNGRSAFESMERPLINIANENAAAPVSANASRKTYSQAIWMIQRMFKGFYLQFACLLLLPGALLTQLKASMAGTFLKFGADDDALSPFAGLMRVVVAVVLVMLAQYVVSCVIDVSNAMSTCVCGQIKMETVLDWAKEQTYTLEADKIDDRITNVSDSGLASSGKTTGVPESQASSNGMNNLSTKLQLVFNSVNNFAASGLLTLNALQLVMMCYLFLMGPIAAALFAWPSGGRGLFRKVFASWLDGVVALSLWKFWWCVVLLSMNLRLTPGEMNPYSQYEMFIYTAFMGVLLFVPFNPFDFRPGDVATQILQRFQEQQAQALEAKLAKKAKKTASLI